MHQGWEALRLGRPLYIVEDLVKNHRISWLHKLIDYGADVLPIKKIEHILEALPLKVQEMPANVTI
jgi:DNA processing protein